MQQDFHFNVIYVLCRCAGIGPEDSRVIANASQYTDDCTLVMNLPKPDGSRYVPVQTQCPGQMAFDERWQREILFPFHFLCDGSDYPFTVPGNARAKGLLDAAIGLLANGSNFRLHALGIALHAFADTFSHQGFSAFHDDRNAADDLQLVPADDALLEQITGRFLHNFPKLPPEIGHARAVYCPDIPFLKWKYRAVADTRWLAQATPGAVTRANGWIERDNAVIAADAARQIAESLATAQGVTVTLPVATQIDFFSSDRFRSLNSLGSREALWRDVFFTDDFFARVRTASDEACFRYEGKEWQGRAVGYYMPPGPGSARLGLKPGYEDTHWWKFQLAAKWVKSQTQPALPA